jgi:hypothetical protein
MPRIVWAKALWKPRSVRHGVDLQLEPNEAFGLAEIHEPRPPGGATGAFLTVLGELHPRDAPPRDGSRPSPGRSTPWARTPRSPTIAVD